MRVENRRTFKKLFRSGPEGLKLPITRGEAMKTWIIIAIVLAVVVVAAVAYTMVNEDDSETGTPAGEAVGCEPCTEGCACNRDAMNADSGQSP